MPCTHPPVVRARRPVCRPGSRDQHIHATECEAAEKRDADCSPARALSHPVRLSPARVVCESPLSVRMRCGWLRYPLVGHGEGTGRSLGKPAPSPFRPLSLTRPPVSGGTALTKHTLKPEAVAASLFVAAVNIFEDDPRMTIAAHTSRGSQLAVTGEIDNSLMKFDPVEIAMFLNWLTRLVTTDPDAIITVTTYDRHGEHTHAWAWHTTTGAALDHEEAAPFFPPTIEFSGAQQPHMVIHKHKVDSSADGLSWTGLAYDVDLSWTSLTDDVKTVITAHADGGRSAAAFRFA